MPCWRATVSMGCRARSISSSPVPKAFLLIPAQRRPGQVVLGLHVMDGVHLDVLVMGVELDTAGHAREALGGRKNVADALGVLAATAHDVGDHHDLVVGVGVEMSRLGVEFRLER